MSIKKCSKYEELYIFSDENKLDEHIKNCCECRKEHEDMLKVSELLKEVKPHYKYKRFKNKLLKTAAAFFVALFALLVFQVTNPNSFVNETIANVTGSSISYEQMGIPVDDYGLIMID